VERWNLDARGHVAGPSLYITFQNAFGCLGDSFNVTSNEATRTNYDDNGNVSSTTTTSASEAVDTVPWSGTANLGSSSRIVRRSSAVTTPNVEPGAFERWTTSLTFTITEVPAD
jgi:YD repeat-containing protein